MAHPQKTIAVVDNEWTVDLYRYLHEVTTQDHCRLVMTQKTPVRKKTIGSVLLVHGLGQNRYTWDLSRRSLENYLVSSGFQTFNVELRGHGLSRAVEENYPDRFRTYLEYDMPAVIQAVSKLSEKIPLFYMGHSLGATLAYCLDGRFHKKLNGIVSIGGPFHMAKGNLLLKTIARTGVLIEKLTPFDLPYPKAFYIDYIGAIARKGLFIMDSPFYRIPLQVWYPGSMERDILTERIAKGFDRTGMNIVRFMFKWGAGGRLQGLFDDLDYEKRIQGLRLPICFLAGDKDTAVPPAAVQPAYDRVGSKDKTLKIFDKDSTPTHWGHIDLISGKNAPGYVWPFLLKWLQARLPA